MELFQPGIYEYRKWRSPIQYHTWRKKMETNEKMRLLPQDKSHFDHSGDEKEKEKLFQSTIIHYNLLK